MKKINLIECEWPPRSPVPISYSIIAALILAGFITAGSWLRIHDGEALLHLKIGEVIVSSGQIPDRDIFFAASGSDGWMVQTWLWDVAAYSLHEAGGWGALNALRAGLLAVALAAVMAQAMALGAGVFAGCIAASLGLLLMLPFVVAGPELAGFAIFAVIQLLVVLSAVRKANWPLFLLPPMFTLWANLDDIFWIGFLPLALAVLWKIRARDGRGVRKKGCLEPQRPWCMGETPMPLAVAAVLVLCVLAALINPYHGKVYAGIFQSVDVRLIGFLILFLMTPLAILLQMLLNKFACSHPGRLLLPAALLLCVIAAAPGALLAYRVPSNAWGTGLRPGVFPETAAGRLAALPMRLAVFNEAEHGGHLIWRLWPAWEVVMDSRDGIYDQNAIAEYERVWSGAPGWEERLTGWRVAAVLGGDDDAQSGGTGLFARLAESENWTAVYWDSDSILYVRSDLDLSETNLAPFRRLRPGLPWDRLEQTQNSPEDWQGLAADLRRAVTDDPGNIGAISLLEKVQERL